MCGAAVEAGIDAVAAVLQTIPDALTARIQPVVDAIETSLQLPIGTLDLERAVLRDQGNMSAPTVLFVLQALIARGLPERVMMTAFGPGFTCAGLVLEA